MMRKTIQKGTGLIEVLVAAAIITFVIFGIVSAYLFYYREGMNNVARVQSAFLLEEGIEALRTFRDSDWTDKIATLDDSTDYHLAFVSGEWVSTTDVVYIDSKFDRTFSASLVYRDGNENIVSSGGTFDSGTRLISVNVSWLAPSGTTTKSLSTYLTNLYNN